MKTINRFLLVFFSLTLTTMVYGQRDQDVPKITKDVVHPDDVIVQGSECVGFDCVNGESFGFDTERLKENNLRIHFWDTSTSASFPSNDWRIVINDSSNGGSNYFGIEDVDAGRMPFRVVAGAPAHSLYVASSGRVGMGTATPVVELHVVDGDSPTMRLEQNGSAGFAQQTWDVAGNETNFFVRDVTNGSRLPFKIRPGALTNSLVIDTDGDVGLGTLTSDAKLHVVGSIKMVDGNQSSGYVMTSDANGVGSWQVASGGGGGGSVWSLNGTDAFYNAGDVGIGTSTPGAKLDVVGTLRSSGNLTTRDGMFSRDHTSLVVVTIGGTTRGNITSTGALTFEVPNGEAMRFLSTGETGIGTDTPSTLLEVDGVASKPGGGAWAVASDKRLKKNINTYTEGLKEVLKFNPITFQYNGKGGIKDTNSTYVGLVAQEAQEVASHMVSEVARTTFKNEEEGSEVKEDFLMLDPSAIPYMLINSVKEQQAQMDAKDAEMEELKSKLENLEQAVSVLLEKMDATAIMGEINHEEDLVLSLNELPFVKQNVPNPYNAETSIEYYIPETANVSELFFYDHQGKLLKKHVLSAKGFGRINLKAADLPAGTYVYSLVIDGKMVSSKKMSIQ